MNVPPKVLRHHVSNRAAPPAPAPKAEVHTRAPYVPPAVTPAEPPADASSAPSHPPAGPSRKLPVASKLPAQTGNSNRLPAAAAGDSIESLPVLKAFDEFLAVERKRTEKRVFLVGVCSLMLMIAVGGAGLFLALYVIRQLQSDIGQVQRDLAIYKGETINLRAANQTMLDRIAEETRRLKTDLARTDNRENAAILERLKAYTTELEGMLAKVDGLKTENAALRSELTNLQATVTEVLASKTSTVVVATTVMPPAAAPTGNTSTTGAAGTQAVAARTSTSMNVLPPGWKEPVTIRLPIPE